MLETFLHRYLLPSLTFRRRPFGEPRCSTQSRFSSYPRRVAVDLEKGALRHFRRFAVLTSDFKLQSYHFIATANFFA